MEGQIDSHQWVSKIQMQCFSSGKPDLKIERDTQADNDDSTLPAESLPGRMSSFFKRAVAEHLCT